MRRALSKYLTASLRPVNASTQNQHLNIEIPRGLAAASTNPPGLQGSRGAYLDAIRTHKQAQAKLERLQSSMEDLQQQHVVDFPLNDTRQENDVVQSYIALLRQRRRHAELEVLQKSLEKLMNVNPIHAHKDPRDLVKNTIGDQPSLPAERLESLSKGETDDSSILKLKKEVLEARSSMEQAKAARNEVQSAPREAPSLQVQVYALARAREEMVDWVQGELVKMEEESGFIEDASPVKRSIINPTDQDLASSESRIQNCYTRYTTSRSTAIGGHQSFQQAPAKSSTQTDTPNNSNAKTQGTEESDTKVRIASFLPHLPHLMQNHTNESLMLSQAVYLKSQISSVDAEMTASLARLADESHVLSSGSKGVAPWGKAVAELETRNENTVRERLQHSRSEINNVTTIVDLCSLQMKVLESD